MSSTRAKYSRALAILFIILAPLSCSQVSLPEVPAFTELGFEDALGAVRQQMLTAYERWQEDPQSPERNGYLGMLFSTYGKNANSELFFRRARILAPEEFRWAYYLALANLQLGRFEEAAGMFRDALTIEPDSIEARIQLAGVLLQTNDIEQSMELYQMITAALPERVDGWLGLGKAFDRKGDYASAIAALHRAKDIGQQYGEVRYALAVVLGASGDDKGAARELAAYEKRAKNMINTSDRFTRAVIRLNVSDGPLMAKADYQIARGQFAEAIRFFRRALEINPANQDAWGGLVYAQAKFEDVEGAADSYQAALTAGINYKRLHFTYGEALRKWQQFDQARHVFAKAIELDPNYTEALLAMGELESERGASAAAVEQYRRAVAVVPNDREVRLSFAQALNAAGQFEEAVKQLEPLTTDPSADKAKTLMELAVAYNGLKRKDEAIDTLQRGLEAAGDAYDRPTGKKIEALLTKWDNATLSP